MTRRLWIPLLILSLALPAGAEERYVAFGDSITEGVGDNSSPPGYPPKLQQILRDAGLDAKVENHGLAGESSFEGLERLDEVLAGGGDHLLLMEGTNDVTMIAEGLLSLESVLANLDAMVSKAKPRGMRVYMGTVIPRLPKAKRDSRNAVTEALNWGIYDLTADRNLPFADGWAHFNPFFTPDVYRRLYAGGKDPIGHPNVEGYEELAQLFADQILEVDTVAPVPGRFAPNVDLLSSGSTLTASMYESSNGAGIAFNETTFVINGEVMASASKGSSTKRRANLKATINRKQLGCRVVLSVNSRDRAEPPNEYSSLLWVYSVEGREHLAADVDGNCTVEQFDLEQFATGFGAEIGEPRFNLLLDFNEDGIIDGRDLAILASRFGETTE